MGTKKEMVKEVIMEVKKLSFSYGTHQILDQISLEIEKGKITTIMGANGCGKSTLFSLMTKNQKQEKGKILLEGKSISYMPLSEFAKKVSIVHQYNSSPEDITVEQLVAFGRTPHRTFFGGSGEEDKKWVEWAIQITNLEEYKDREVGKLSGGQRQRVWIAMALAQNTGILFLDEPTTYLDIRYQLEILELIRKLNGEYGITIVMVLHDINQAIHFSHRIFGLKDGKVVVSGEPEKVITTESIHLLYGIDLNVADIDGHKFVLTV